MTVFTHATAKREVTVCEVYGICVTSFFPPFLFELGNRFYLETQALLLVAAREFDIS
jgi:hypothetical protein